MADTAMSETKPKRAGSPFDSDTADVILRTSDGVDFHVFQAVLALASPFFKTMFTLNRPPVRDGLCSCMMAKQDPVPVSEDSDVLDHLLRFCYPVRDPIISDLDVVGRVLAAAMKYEMDDPIYTLRQCLSARITDSAAHVYVICCQQGLADLAQTSAIAFANSHGDFVCKQQSFPVPTAFSETLAGRVYSDVLNRLSAGDYYRLLEFIPRAATFKPNNPTQPHELLTRTYPSAKKLKKQRHLSVWNDGDACLVSSDGVEFMVHRLVLKLASAEHLFANGPTKDSEASVEDLKVKIYQTAIRSTTLRGLLQACYPPSSQLVGSAENWRLSFDVLRAAEQLKLTTLTKQAKSRWNIYVQHDPLGAYFGATSLKWTVQAEEAARATTDMDISQSYSEEMENVPAKAYQQLLNYHYRYLTAARTALFNAVSNSEETWRVLALNRIANPLSSSQAILFPITETYKRYGVSYSVVADVNTRVKNDLSKVLQEIKLDVGE